MPPRLLCLPLLMLGIVACNGQVYLRNGVTDGDTFYLAEHVVADNDPVLQSWVTYSLARSTCQLQMDDKNPARATSYSCELSARKLLLQTWREQQEELPGTSDAYLDDLATVQAAGYLDEYVVAFLREKSWTLPGDLDARAFREWRLANLRDHEAQSRITGSWNYARNVSGRKDSNVDRDYDAK